MGVKVANNAASIIVGAISSTDTGITVTAGTGSLFPTLGAGDYFYATLVSAGGTREIVKVTARASDAMTIVRGQEGTTAQSFATGSRLELRITAASITDMIGEHDQASEIAFTPTGSIAATNVQSAIVELDGDVTTFKADLASTTAGKGAALIGLAQGGDAQDMADVYKNAVFSASYASVEAAHAAAVSASKTYVVVNSAWTLTANFTATLKIIFAPGFTVSCGAYTLNLSNGFWADDTQQVFLAADASKITLPQWQRLTPQHFGAEANYVNSGSRGTDDGPALQAWASKLCTRVMPAGKYGTTITINWNGDAVVNQNAGMQCDPQAWIYQRTDNIPIMTCYGSRGVWQFPILEYMNRQASGNYGAVGLLVAPYPGQTGWYSNIIERVMVRGGANVGMFVPPAISSTTTASYTAGTTAITVANAQTDALGSYPWVPGMWVQIALAAGGYHFSRISTVSGANLTLATALSGAVNNNAVVASSGATPPSTFPAAMFSNTVHFILVDEPARYGVVMRGTGTGDAIANMYVRSAGSGDVTAPPYTIETAVYISGQTAGSIAQLNVEYLGMNSNAVFISGRHFKLGEVHIEGVRSYGNFTGLISGSIADMDIDLVQVEYWTVLASDVVYPIANAAAILYPRATTGTALGSGRGQWRIRQLNTRKNVMERQPPNGRAFVAAYATGTLTQIKIDDWVYNRDGGIYPNGQICSPSNAGALVAIGNLLPPNCVAQLLGVDANSTSYQRIFTSPKGQFKVGEILALDPSTSLTTATCGVYADNTGTTLISSVNNQALSTLTDTGKVLSIPLAAGEATVLRAGSSDMFYKGNAAQALPAAVVTDASGTSQLTGRNGGDNNTNLAIITFTLAHGFRVGQTILITGSVNTSLNSKRYVIVDVPTTTQLVVYADSATAVATVADTALSAQLVPTFHLIVTGSDVANFDAW